MFTFFCAKNIRYTALSLHKQDCGITDSAGLMILVV
jgi:hypothetical protein